MKNLFTLFLFSIINFACSKERTCTCDQNIDIYKKNSAGDYIYYASVQPSVKTTVEKSTRRQSKAICKDRTWVESFENSDTKNKYQITNCKLK